MSKRRSNGEGLVRKRADGRWEARLTYVDPAGARKTVSFYGPTEADVRDQLKTGRERAERFEPVRDSAQTLGGYLEHWITALEASDRKPSTVSQQRGLLKRHVIPALGRTPLGKLLPSDISTLLGRMKRAGLSDSTRKSTFLALRVALAGAVADGLIAANPAAKLTTPKIHREEADYLTPEQSRLLLSHLGGLRYEAAVRLMLSTGMRRGEVAGLEWRDFSVDAEGRGSLRVRRTTNRIDGKLVTTTVKTAKSRRTIPLGVSTAQMLRAHKAAQAAERLAAGDRWQDSGRIFATELGGEVDPRNLNRTVEIAAKKAGIKASAHALRHAAGSAMVEAGFSLPTVRDILGHSSVQITGDIYSHPSEAAARAAVDSWAEQLGM